MGPVLESSSSTDVNDSASPLLPAASAPEAIRLLADRVSMLVWMVDANDTYLYLNGSARAFFKAGEVMRLADWINCLHPDDRERAQATLRAARAAREEYQVEYRIVCSDGSVRWMMGCGAPHFDATGAYAGYVGTTIDVSDRYEALARLARSEQRFRSLTSLSVDWYWETDEADRIVFLSEGSSAWLEQDASGWLGRSRAELFGDADCATLAECGARLKARQPFKDLIHERRCPGEQPRYASLSGEPIHVDGDYRGYRGVGRDVTERMRNEASLVRLATHDALTGLPNRTLLNQRLEQSMVRARRDNESLAVMFVDLDRFKAINDSMGHGAGDALLKQVAGRLRGVIRDEDHVARLGGDEFVIVARCPDGKASAEELARHVLASLKTPVDLPGQEVVIGASIGIGMFPSDGSSAEVLFRNADTAMYRAKAAGRNGYRFFLGAMAEQVQSRMAIESALRRADFWRTAHAAARRQKSSAA